jgi:hypothetical protein
MSGTMLSFAFREGSGYRMRLTYNEPQHTRGKTSEDADEVEVRFVKTEVCSDARERLLCWYRENAARVGSVGPSTQLALGSRCTGF